MLEWRSPTLDAWVTHFTDLGSTEVLPFLGVGATIAIAWWWRSWTPVLLMAIACGGGLLMTVVGKSMVGRERPAQEFAVPPYETSASFPSGHTMNTWIICAMVAYLVIVKLHHLVAQVACRRRRGGVRRRDGAQPGLPRPPLDDRRRDVMGARHRVGDRGHRRTPGRRRDVSASTSGSSSNSTQNSLPSGSLSTTCMIAFADEAPHRSPAAAARGRGRPPRRRAPGRAARAAHRVGSARRAVRHR